MRRLSAMLLPILLLALAQLACAGTPVPPPISNTVDAEASRDQVTAVKSTGQRQPLPAPQHEALTVGDGVDVDEVGRALLRFGDTLTVEVLREGELVLKELEDSEQAFQVTLLQRFGVLFNDFNPAEEIKRRLTIQTDQAVIVATGTRFLVVREAATPLDWVIALEAKGEDLQVTAAGVTRPVPAGMARWVAPGTEPSEAIPIDVDQVQAWLEALRRGQRQPEVGEVLWPQADLLATTEPLRQQPEPGQSFVLNGVIITPDPQGLFGGPEYWLEDCNGDGIQDVAMQGGRLFMDFRQIPARVRALDVTVFNRGGPGSGYLTAFDPAQKELGSQKLAAEGDQMEVLSLRTKPGQPIHHAELGLAEGCFLGFSLTPPTVEGEPGEPRPAVEAPVSEARVEFAAQPTTIAPGDCTTLYWQVENARAVFLEDQPVEPQGSQQVCLKRSRTFTLLAMSAAGEQVHQVTVEVREAGSELDDFVGEWVNVDPETRGLTRIIIEREGDVPLVQGFGRCHPKDCDLGMTKGRLVRGTLLAVFEYSFKVLQLRMTRKEDLLVVQEINKFTDGSDRDYELTEAFKRQVIILLPTPPLPPLFPVTPMPVTPSPTPIPPPR